MEKSKKESLTAEALENELKRAKRKLENIEKLIETVEEELVDGEELEDEARTHRPKSFDDEKAKR
ncbi:hypothetical protein [Hydrogenimonas sp.]